MEDTRRAGISTIDERRSPPCPDPAPVRLFDPEWRDDRVHIVYPLGPDPAWVNTEWQDILGESDTFVAHRPRSLVRLSIRRTPTGC